VWLCIRACSWRVRESLRAHHHFQLWQPHSHRLRRRPTPHGDLYFYRGGDFAFQISNSGVLTWKCRKLWSPPAQDGAKYEGKKKTRARGSPILLYNNNQGCCRFYGDDMLHNRNGGFFPPSGMSASPLFPSPSHELPAQYSEWTTIQDTVFRCVLRASTHTTSHRRICDPEMIAAATTNVTILRERRA
jgi:hypothetical protein